MDLNDLRYIRIPQEDSYKDCYKITNAENRKVIWWCPVTISYYYTTSSTVFISSETIFYGQNATPPVMSASIGDYYANSWNTTFDNIKRDLTATFTYDRKFTVTFKDDVDHAVIESRLLSAGSSISKDEYPDEVFKQYYTFKDWEPEQIDNLIYDQTVLARYSENVVVVDGMQWQYQYDGEDHPFVLSAHITNNIEPRIEYSLTGKDGSWSTVKISSSEADTMTSVFYRVTGYNTPMLSGIGNLRIAPARIFTVTFDTNGGTIVNSDPTHDDKFLKLLADWGLSSERPEDLPEPSLSVNLMSSNYILNDGYVDDSGTYISVDTVAKITENLDKLSTVNFPWMIWGYDIDIPEYVKYRNGDDFVYVRSVQDVSSDWNVAGSLVEDFVGKEIFECSWNSESYEREYSAINTVKSVSDEKFTYGNNCTYSVPQKITDNDGKEYTFCGHTATLHSKNLVTSTSDGSTKRFFESFNTSSRDYTKQGNNQYYCSMIRQYINSRVGYSEFNPPPECGEMYTGWGLARGSNGLLAKFYKDVNFMKRIMKQVNRVWDQRNQNNPDICIDEMGLIPVSHTGYEEEYNTTYDTSKASLYGSLQTDTLRQKYRMDTDGTPWSQAHYWWLRSAHSSREGGVGVVSYTGYILAPSAGVGVCCSPLVLIG